MSITDELREYASRWLSPNKGMLLAIADRIDAEHESKISRAAQLLADAEKDRDFNYANWQDCKQKVLQHNITIDELDAEIERLKDELAHCIELPKDANGEYIHIGDRMEHIELGYVLEVIAVGIDCFIAWNTHLNRYWQYDNKLFRHHHEPTVEDVLAEFALEIDPSADIAVTGAETIKKFAAKLQIKESE